MATADYTTGLLSEALYQDDAASTTLSASFGASGSIKNGGSAGPNSSALSVTGPGGNLPKAIRFDGDGDYGHFDIDDSTGIPCTLACIARRTGQLASLDGIVGCYTSGANALAIICPGSTTDQLGYQHGGYASSHVTATELRMPIYEWVILAVSCRAEQAVITIMDLAGRVQQKQVVATHTSINHAGNLYAGWRGVSSGQHLAPVDIAAHALWDEEKTLVDIRGWAAAKLGAAFWAAQSTTPTIPIASGEADDAAALLDGSKGRWIALGDSNMGDWVQAIDRLIVGQHGAVRGICSRNVSGWQTFTTATGVSATAHDSAVIGTAATAKITRMDFNGGTAPSGAYTLRTINSVAIGTDSRYSTRDHMRDAWGYCPILRAKQEERDLTLRVPIYKHPNGCTNAAVQIVLEYDGTQIVAGSGFTGYAATAGWVYETVTVPHASLPDDFIKLTVHLCLVDSVVTQSGKYLWSAGLGVELYDPQISEGSMVHVFAEGGTQAEDFAASAYLTDAQYGLMSLIAPDCYVIDFGVNMDTSADSAADQRDGIVSLITRVRSFSPSALVALKSAWSIYHNHGGEYGQAPIYAEANYLAQQQTANCLHVNVPRMLLNFAIARGTARDNWSEHNAKHYFPAMSIVLDSGTFYLAKQSHIKGSNSSPSSDTTNWLSTGLTSAGLASDTGYASKLGSRHEYENTIHYDDPVHGHPYGHRLAALAFVTGLKWLAGVSDNEIRNALNTLETAVDAVVATTVSADIVDAGRTWIGQDYRASNIVEVKENFAGVLALKPDLNPGTTIASVDSVSITGAATVTATSLTVDRSKTKAHFTVPALTTTGTYTVVVTVTTIEGDVIPTTATLKVY